MTSVPPINIEDIYFGDRDGLHEYMKQDKDNITILENSFVNPPRVKLDELRNGSRFYIVGPKGSGKTTLLWHLKRGGLPNKSKVILFKSHIRKEDRDQLDRMIDLIVVEDQNSVRLEADYKAIWEWYLLKNIVRIIEPSDLLDGESTLKDIAILLEANQHKFNTLYDKFNIESAKGAVKINFDIGALKTEISAEILARRNIEGKVALLDLVRLVQASLPTLKLKKSVAIRLYFDELEFFISSDGDGERDRRMIRDLLFAIYSINTLCSDAGLDICSFASVRSEILGSINTTTQELSKSISSFGVNLNWHNENTENHPVLSIFENKIRASEVNQCGNYSEDVWSQYFPELVNGKDTKKYLLDSGLHRPRGVLLRLSAAAELAYGKKKFSESDFLNSEERFGEMMLEEFVEEISANYDEPGREAILSLFRGNHFAFNRESLQSRILKMSNKDKNVRKIRDEIGVDNVLRLLFRIGMIGNQFDIEETGQSRQVWGFRGANDPLLDKRFVIHQSVRKVLATV